MTPKTEPSRKARRKVLGAELRRARQRAGISVTALAKTLGMSYSTVSRIESGDRPVTAPQVQAWARAAGGDEERLEWLAEQALTEDVPLVPWRAQAGPEGIQENVFRRLELPSRYIASFCPCYLTGLLQTPEYARRVYSTFLDPGQVAAAVAARLERQQVLYDPARRLEFILAEAALRWRSGPADFLVPQLERLISLAALPNVAFYVIPSDADMKTVPLGEFTLYDGRDDGEPVAAMETQHKDVETAKPDEVPLYREELDKLRRSALSGEDAVAFIRDLTRAL